jgi:hypothetical protein
MPLLHTVLQIDQMHQEKHPYQAEHMEQLNTTQSTPVMEDLMQMLQ